LSNLTPADVYLGRDQTILLQRERIKRQTIQNRRLLHQNKAASDQQRDGPEPPLNQAETCLESSDDGYIDRDAVSLP
jgi:hypothetical protein